MIESNTNAVAHGWATGRTAAYQVNDSDLCLMARVNATLAPLLCSVTAGATPEQIIEQAADALLELSNLGTLLGVELTLIEDSQQIADTAARSTLLFELSCAHHVMGTMFAERVNEGESNLSVKGKVYDLWLTLCEFVRLSGGRVHEAVEARRAATRQ